MLKTETTPTSIPRSDPTTPSRLVHCQDALAWLGARSTFAHTSMVSSLPDFSEFPGYTLNEWKHWFTQTAELILSRCSDDGVSIFYQSDIKVDGTWIDKSFLCQRAAENAGHSLLWHKIFCRAPVGTRSFGRPGYSHLLCFSKTLRLHDLNLSSADVMAHTGPQSWTRGMGLAACLLSAQFIATQTSSVQIVNPFCGEGGMLAAANLHGLHAVGIERSSKRAEKSRHQQISVDQKSWVDPFEKTRAII